MRAVPDALALRAQVEGRRPWTGHDVLVVTAADEPTRALHAERLGRLFAKTPLRVLPVLDRRLGNLTGTVEAWAAVRDQVGPEDRVAVVHDAGQATRSGWVTRSTGGSRGALQLGARVAGQPVDLLGMVAITAMAWADEPDGVDVFWGSQLTVPARLGASAGWLCKQGRPAPEPGAVTAEDLHDLGWIATAADGAVQAFAAQQRFDRAEGFAAWARGFSGPVLADLGSARFDRGLLDALDAFYAGREPRKRNLDPDLTRPWVHLLAGGAPRDGSEREVAALLGADPRLATAGAVRCRAFEGEWVRMRRPEEFRAGLTGLGDHPSLRVLWGIRTPVERSWVGEQWVEGPEVDWEQMAAGVEVGGVRLRGAVVRDSRLEPGSEVDGSWVWACVGRVQAQRSALVEAVDPEPATDGLVDRSEVGPRPPSAALIDRWARFPLGSDPRSWAGRLQAGALELRRGPADGPRVRLDAPKGADRGQLVVRTDLWPRVGSPDEGMVLLEGLVALSDPAGRRWPPDLAGWRPPAVPDHPAALEQAIDGWDLARDPLRLALGTWMAAWEPGPIRTLAALRVAWRVLLERDRCDVASGWAAIRAHLDADPAPWLASGAALRLPSGAVLPAFPLDGASVDGLAAVGGHGDFAAGAVIGLCGSAAAGKSTLAEALVRAGAERGLEVVRLETDGLTFAGHGFRYTQGPHDRVEHLEGPGIYDDRAVGEALDALRRPDRVVVADGVFLGLDPAVRARLDRLFLVQAPAAVRLARKLARDSAPGADRTIDIPTDFARKLFREDRDAMHRLAALADQRVHSGADPMVG